MANTLMSLLVAIGIDSSEFKDGIKDAESGVEAFSTRAQNLGKNIAKVGGALTAGITLPLAAFGASSVQSFQAAEAALTDLEATLASTNHVAGVSIEQLTEHASALQKVTKFSDEAIMGGQGMLLTFTKIGADVFPDATVAMLNMAEKFGGVEQASIQLGKALNDPIQGVAALRRVGIQLTEAQEEQIKQFMEVGDIASAQRVILGELETQFGGLAEAMGQTTTGKIEQFKNQLDDVKETIGAALIPVLLRFLEAITPLIEQFANASPQMQNFIIVLAGILAAAGPVITAVGGLVSGIGAIAPVIATVAGVLSGPVLAVIAAVVAAVGLLYLAWKTNFFGIRDTAMTVWEAIKLVFQAFKAAFEGDWRGFGELLRQAWDLVWGLIETRINNAWNIIKQAAINIVNGVRQAFQIDWGELGRNIISGLVNGIRNGIGAVVNAARSVAQAASQAVQGFLGIHSPSTLMYQYGQNTAQGFALGMRENGGMNIPAVLGIGASAAPAPSGKSQGGDIIINIENPKKETSEESIRRTLKGLSYTGVIPA